jgi:hypothetical protein
MHLRNSSVHLRQRKDNLRHTLNLDFSGKLVSCPGALTRGIAQGVRWVAQSIALSRG